MSFKFDIIMFIFFAPFPISSPVTKCELFTLQCTVYTNILNPRDRDKAPQVLGRELF